MNVAIVRGRLSSAPRTKELGSGDVLVRYEVTVARDDGPDESVPVSWVGPARKAPSTRLEAGDEVVLWGRVRRRWYRAGAATASATEVLADRLVPGGDRRRAAAVIDAAVAALAAAAGP